MDDLAPPESFELFASESPFIHLVGPFFVSGLGGRRRVGTRVMEHHLNKGNVAHGGFLLTLADVALSLGSFEPGDVPPKVTLSLNTEFAGPVRVGDWIEAEVDVIRIGRSLSFLRCDMTCDGERFASASGTFRNLSPPADGD